MINATYVNELINKMVETDAYEGVFAAGAKPLLRTDDGTFVFKDHAFSPDDVVQLLVLLRQKSKFANSPLEDSGTFSFGIRGIGRFTVEYLQQRGTIAVFLKRIRDRIFDLREAITSREFLPIFVHMLDQGEGLFVVSGRNRSLNMTVSASIVNYIARRRPSVIYTVESPQSHLLKHENSVVIQREVGSDVESFERGIEQALSASVDVLYINDIPDEVTLNSVFRAVEKGVLVITTLSAAGIPHTFMYFETITINPLTMREFLAQSLQLLVNPSGFDRKAGILNFQWMVKKEEAANLIRLGNYFELERFVKKS